MPHLYFCRETDCEYEAHVYGGRCDDCFEAYIVRLREEHNPTSHKCSGEFDFYRGIYVCDDNDDPRCPSHHLARSLHTEMMTREDILIEIKYRESMLAWDRGEIDHAAVRFGIERLRRQLAQMCEDCGNQLSVVRAGEQTVCHPCAGRRNSIVSPRDRNFCDECGEPSNNGRATCLCWADEEDLARMDRDAALHR